MTNDALATGEQAHAETVTMTRAALADHDRKVAAKALREAADDMDGDRVIDRSEDWWDGYDTAVADDQRRLNQRADELEATDD